MKLKKENSNRNTGEHSEKKSMPLASSCVLQAAELLSYYSRILEHLHAGSPAR